MKLQKAVSKMLRVEAGWVEAQSYDVELFHGWVRVIPGRLAAGAGGRTRVKATATGAELLQERVRFDQVEQVER